MSITGIICEYNPFHSGHKKQFDIIRQENPESAIVCLMSGNFVQRGMPAVFHKALRAKAAILSGADLVLELPVTAALSSAEGFAARGVAILNGFCDTLSFGAETADAELLQKTANILISPEFTVLLKEALGQGLSFPAARQKALESLGADSTLLTRPNNILAVEYCKAILTQNAKIRTEPILRQGEYHDTAADTENPSATSLRLLIEAGKPWDLYTTSEAYDCFGDGTVHTLSRGEKAVLYRLKTMTEQEYEALPYGSEGLWHKLMKNARSCRSLEEILTATKSKRYTRTRLDRMVMCAVLGLTEQDMTEQNTYSRVLALNNRGRDVLIKARETGLFPNSGEKLDHPYQEIENRCDGIYDLFAGELSDREPNRVYYHKT